jgi:hypothetical protein
MMFGAFVINIEIFTNRLTLYLSEDRDSSYYQVASQLKGVKLELKELKAHSLLLGACLECSKLKLELDDRSLKVKELVTKLLKKSRVSVTSPPCEVCGTHMGKLVNATKENTELKHEIAYLTSRLERAMMSEKMIKDDLNRVEESATTSTYKLGVSFERCEDKGEKSAPKFVPSSNYHKEEETLKSTKTHYPSNLKPSFNSKREVRKETTKLRDETFIYMFCGCAGHLDGFCFCRKRIKKRHFEYATNSYCDEFIDFPPRTSSRASPRFFHRPNHRSYGFGSSENDFVTRRFGYGPSPHHGDRPPRRHDFLAVVSYIHFESRHLDGPHFPHHSLRPTHSNGEVQKIVKTSSGRIKCWIPKFYLTNPCTEPSTSSRPM